MAPSDDSVPIKYTVSAGDVEINLIRTKADTEWKQKRVYFKLVNKNTVFRKVRPLSFTSKKQWG